MAGFRCTAAIVPVRWCAYGGNILIGIMMMFIWSTSAWGQISPGELHESHAFLEGVENCIKCHSPQGDQLSDKCLVCHTSIADQKKTGKGLHARQDYSDCYLCHVEHHGRDFELIYFKGGQKAFDHSQTGFKLDGKHAALDCRNCHLPRFITDQRIRNAKNLSLENTLLGLSSECSSCHFDEHRGQLPDNCTECHTTVSWKPATGFDHAKAAFHLEGKHEIVPCLKCHISVADSGNKYDKEFQRFKPVAFQECTSCHNDVHKGRLGANCTGCHTPSGWRVVKTADFNHDQTRFPLRGKHTGVTCKECHGQRSTAEPLKFAACTDCHSDFHKGAFASRESKGACEECHTVDGFIPSTFRIDQHALTDYPLKGAHLAVPCRQCHVVTSSASGSKFKFVFSTMECKACHDDPHRGQVNKFVSSDGCQSCHSENSWRTIAFDHSRTEFPLDGKHASVLCRECHAGKGEFKVASMVFRPLEKNCRSCHSDIHRGQFAYLTEKGDCASCHNPSGWDKLDFNHDINSRFALEGAHKKVACAECHMPESDDAGSYTRYRPLDIKCESCHGTKPVKQESG